MTDQRLSNNIFLWVYLFLRMFHYCAFYPRLRDFFCCLTFRNSNRCDFISFSGAWRRTWLLSVSFSQSCPEKRQELSNSPSEEKRGYNYSRYWGNNCNFTAVKCQHPLSQPVALTEKCVSQVLFFPPFFSQVSPKVPDSGQFSSYPRKFPTD